MQDKRNGNKKYKTEKEKSLYYDDKEKNDDNGNMDLTTNYQEQF